ncbi:MAG: hypothetical protein J0I20_13425 [Chloroflexi bacterium]|nr:hypothetical protein [Chloroflexota bacterium]OJV92853.1 MAG: hypothetical protein BGO39_30325 [Chloroflexi bacterium 54-19]
MKAKPVILLFMAALLFGFINRFLGDSFHTFVFQEPLTLLIVGVLTTIGFNLFCSLKPWLSGLLVGGWFLLIWFGYTAEGLVHNYFQPDEPYDVFRSSSFMSMNFFVTYWGLATLAFVFGFVVGVVIPLLIIRKKRRVIIH